VGQRSRGSADPSEKAAARRVEIAELVRRPALGQEMAREAGFWVVRFARNGRVLSQPESLERDAATCPFPWTPSRAAPASCRAPPARPPCGLPPVSWL